jgi:hypothetical protein
MSVESPLLRSGRFWSVNDVTGEMDFERRPGGHFSGNHLHAVGLRQVILSRVSLGTERSFADSRRVVCKPLPLSLNLGSRELLQFLEQI